MKAAIVLTVCASVGLAVFQPCPAPSTILPCVCTGRYQTSVTCSNVSDFGFIKKTLTGKFENQIIYTLVLTNVKEKTVERGAAQALSKLGTLVIVDSPMVESLASNSLMDMPELSWVHIINTSLTSIPTAALAKVSALGAFTCRYSKITRLLKKDFDGISKELVGLDFKRNAISSIEEETFTGFPRLKWLDLPENRLKTLPSGHWLSANSLKLDLSDNKIGAIPMEGFSGMKNSVIKLFSNEIRQVPNEVEMMKFINNGNELRLYGNPLQCGCDLKWIPNYGILRSTDPPLSGKCRGKGLRQSKWFHELTAADFSDCNSATL